ncbi:MAG: hypothetical protein V3V67_03745 [Myxococcota bacterium]
MNEESRSYERTMVAFMEDPDAPRPENPIHSTSGALEYGYRAALVGGVVVYGWATPGILAMLGETWLEDGWAEIAFRRPTYPGDPLTIRLAEHRDGLLDLAMEKAGGEVAVVGQVGLGRAPWFGLFELPERRKAEPRPERLPRLTLESAPVGQDLRPLAWPISAEAARRWAVEREGDESPLFTRGDRPVLHPGWIAGVMSPLVHHSYDYGPSIHARSHIQHLARARAGQTLTVAAHMVRTYTRKGHHYHETDGVIIDETGHDLAYIRHTTIFQLARRSPENTR